MELGPEDVSLLERCPHFRGWYVQASMELGPEDVSLLESVLISEGGEDVSLLERYHLLVVYIQALSFHLGADLGNWKGVFLLVGAKNICLAMPL